MLKRDEIQIRDPFILSVSEEQKYYLYGTTDKNAWEGKGTGFDVYISNDLEIWDGPFNCFCPASNFWADRNFWAPEVYKYQDKYFMFATFKSENACRGTQILISDDPKGPFLAHSEGPVTPKEWECLDGTFFLDDDNNPWIIFCREWLQVFDGEIYAMRLNHKLNCALGKPELLFRASEAPWTRHHLWETAGTTYKTFVTDGPFIHRTSSGEVLMIWSSFGEYGYAIGSARSSSGKITGQWIHDKEPLFSKDGGHGMLFHTFEGKLMLTIHKPNQTPNERPIFLEVYEDKGRLIIK